MQFLKAPLTLIIISLLVSTSLGILYFVTQPHIAKVQAESQSAAFYTLIERSENFSAVPDSEPELKERIAQVISQAKEASSDGIVRRTFTIDKDFIPGLPKLYILELAGRGFGGPMQIFAAYTENYDLWHAVLLENTETPGFGKKAEEPVYMQMFWGQGPKAKKHIPTVKNDVSPEYLDAVTGSTISFTAISSALKGGADWLMQEGL